jgi:type IV secretion system protein VirB11
MNHKDLAEKRYLDMLETACGREIMRLLNDDSVIEIMLNPDGHLFVERLNLGKKPTGVILPATQSENIIKLVASYKNQVVHEGSPMIATEIPFLGARFQGWLPPIAKQPTFAIRKRATHIFTLDHYVKNGALPEEMANFLKEAVLDRKNILIAGGTASGKTTFANALLDVLSGSTDRMIVLEDLPELQIACDDVVMLGTTDIINMRDLVKGTLRMRPDRIIMGEVRDGAALELLKSWNTGHPGGICTIHANSLESTPYRVEDLIREVVMSIPHNLILQAIDLIIFIERDKNGLRKVSEIGELSGFNQNRYETHLLYKNKQV